MKNFEKIKQLLENKVETPKKAMEFQDCLLLFGLIIVGGQRRELLTHYTSEVSVIEIAI